MSQRTISEDTITSPVLKESLFRRKLACGLDAYVIPRPGFWKKYATLTTRYGSIDSCFLVPGCSQPRQVPAGIAHFLEHEVFEEETGNAFQTFAALGASANAYTTYTHTSYLFATTDNFEQCLRFLLTFVGRLRLTKDKVEREKDIIEQELRMYEDIPRFKVQTNLLQALFHEHPVRIDIGGTVESVRQITQAQLELCHSTFYHPGNMVVFAAGDFDPGETLDLIEEAIYTAGVWNLEPRPAPQRFFPDEPHNTLENRVICSMEVPQPLFNMGFKDIEPGLQGERILRRELLTSILLEMVLGRGSDLYTSLYEEGLIDDTLSAGYMGERDYGVTIIGGQTPDPERLENRLLDGFHELADKGLKVDDFERLKKKTSGQFLGFFNQPEGLAQAFIHHYLHDVDLFHYYAALDSLCFEEAEARFRDFLDPNRRAVSLVVPTSQPPS